MSVWATFNNFGRLVAIYASETTALRHSRPRYTVRSFYVLES